MIECLRAFAWLQVFLCAALLGLSAVTKLSARPAGIRPTAFAKFGAKLGLRFHSVRRLWGALGLLEGGTALWLLSGVARDEGLDLAAGLFLGATGYVAVGLRFAQSSTCGCFGASGGISWATLTRASLLTVAALSCRLVQPPLNLSSVIGDRIATLLLLGLAEILLLVSVSSEVKAYRARFRSRLAAMLPVSVKLSSRGIRRSYAMIAATGFWKSAVLPLVGAAPRLLDAWKEGEWLLTEMVAESGDQEYTILAARRVGYWRRRYRVQVFASIPNGLEALLSWDSATSSQYVQQPADHQARAALGVDVA